MSLVLTRMQNLRSSTNIDKNEYRASRYGALDAFKAMSNDPDSIITQEMKDKVNQSNGRVFELGRRHLAGKRTAPDEIVELLVVVGAAD